MVYLTVLMFIKEGKEAIFNKYEASVLPLLSNYNGKLLYRIKPKKEDYINAEEEIPYEIHLISFNTNNDFLDYINDNKRKSFETLKDDAIKSTFIVKGEKI